MGWNWIAFFVSLVIFFIGGGFIRGKNNDNLTAKYGDIGDYKKQPLSAIIGQIIGAVPFAALVALIVGSVF